MGVLLFLEVILDYRERLQTLAEQFCAEVGVELVELDLFQAGKRKLIRLFVDKEGGVNIDDCAHVSRLLGGALELEDVIPEAYNLEVSSPGLDRPLKSTRDFQRNLGRMVRVTKAAGKPLVGELVSVDEEALVLVPKGAAAGQVRIERGEILVAKVEVQF